MELRRSNFLANAPHTHSPKTQTYFPYSYMWHRSPPTAAPSAPQTNASASPARWQWQGRGVSRSWTCCCRSCSMLFAWGARACGSTGWRWRLRRVICRGWRYVACAWWSWTWSACAIRWREGWSLGRRSHWVRWNLRYRISAFGSLFDFNSWGRYSLAETVWESLLHYVHVGLKEFSPPIAKFTVVFTDDLTWRLCNFEASCTNDHVDFPSFSTFIDDLVLGQCCCWTSDHSDVVTGQRL